MRSKYDDFFKKTDDQCWKCKLCNFKTTTIKDSSTSTRRFHLEKNHKKEFADISNDESFSQPLAKKPRLEEKPKGHQLKITDDLFRPTADSKSMKIDDAIIELICTANLPLSLVNHQSFQRLLKLLDPRYKLRANNYFTRHKLPEFYDKLCSKVKAVISKVDHYSLVLDEWTDVACSHPLLGISIHFVNEDLIPKHFVLSAQPIDGRKTAENLSKCLDTVFDEFGLDRSKLFYVLRDGASVMSKLARINEFTSMHCLAHGLQLVVNDATKAIGITPIIEKVKSLIAKLRKSSILQKAFHNAQILEDLPKKNLEIGIEVRWNSLYTMFLSFKDNKKAIQQLCLDENIDGLDRAQWETLEEWVSSLEGFYIATMLLQKRDAFISVVIPILEAIKMDLKRKMRANEGNVLLIETLLSGLEDRFNDSLSKRDFVMATLIDPRFKKKYLSSQIVDIAKVWIVEELLDDSIAAPVEPLEDANIENLGDLFDAFEKANESTPDRELPQMIDEKHLIQAELFNYLNEPNINKDACVGTYWKVNGSRFPRLKKLYCKLATAPATSSEAERLFSIAGLVLTDMRKRLDDNNVKKLLFLNCNIKVLNYEY